MIAYNYCYLQQGYDYLMFTNSLKGHKDDQ